MRLQLLLAFLTACDDEPKGADSGLESGEPADTDTDSDTDTDTDTDADTDTDTDTDTGPAPDTVSDLGWELHADVQSLVWAEWTQNVPATVHVEFWFDTDDVRSTPTVEAEVGHHRLLLAGIPFDSSAEWELVTDDGEHFEGLTITTGEYPDLPTGVVTVSEPDAWMDTDNYLLTSINARTGGWTGGSYWTIIIDRQGRLVWANNTPLRRWTLYSQIAMEGGYFLWDEATYWSEWDDGANSSVHSTWLDEEIDEVATPGLHHAFIQLPDGNLAWGSQNHGGGEALVEMPREEGDVTVLWTCDADWGGYRGCESNGLWYSPERDTYLYSFYTNSTLVEIDRSTGETLWWAGERREGYSFDAADSQFSWQHGISWTDAGTLLVSTLGGSGSSRSTRVYEYDIDEDAALLTLIWSSDSGTYAETNGDALRLENGDTMHIIGSSGELREVDPDGEDVWRVDFGGTYLLGRGEFFDDLYDLVSPSGRGEE